VYAKARVHFNAHEMEKTISIKIVDDDIAEDDETFSVRLFDLKCHHSHVTLSPMHSVARILIVDDDRPGVISMSQKKVEIQEGHGAARMVLVRQGGGKGALTVDYATKDGSAIADKDYIAVAGTLTFEDSELEKEVLVEIIDDEMYGLICCSITHPEISIEVFLC
jgi:hypothetical protein